MEEEVEQEEPLAETLDGELVPDTDGDYERPVEDKVAPEAKPTAKAAAQPEETVESLRQERDRRAREADAARAQQREIMSELRQLRAWQQEQRQAAIAEHQRFQQAAAAQRRQEAYADAPDYVLDLADQIQATQQLVLTQEQQRRQEEWQASTQEQQLRQTGDLMEGFLGELKSEADPELGQAMVYETNRALQEIHWTASAVGEQLTDEEARQIFAEQLAQSLYRTATMTPTDRANFFKQMAAVRGWRPEMPAGAKPPNGAQGGKSPAQAAQEAARARQARQAPLSGPATTGANGASEVNYAAIPTEDYVEMRLTGKISQRQADAYEQGLLSGS